MASQWNLGANNGQNTEKRLNLVIDERLDGSFANEVLGINVYSHRALEQLSRGFNAANDA